ncbi:HAD family hydrolase [Myxosarcina sp. GI1]|uniref:HAD family hydrolase n=1 Tax=Myxosarcina sp. GI1 TaxID=1541065 RepID=UPI00055A8373|nr:HAD family hydrolase [Myxosarcina sp. GI1]
MSKLQALIFDVDGTLANTEEDGHRVAFNHAFEKAELDWHWKRDLYRELLAISGGKERIKFYLQQQHPAIKFDKDIKDFIADLHQIKSQYYQQLLASGKISFRTGVKRLISAAKAESIRLAIATTSSLESTEALIRHFHPDWFEVIAAGDIVPHKKPAPDIYNYVLEQMNLSPKNCLVFEDSQHGLQAAIAAGIKTIVTVNDYTKEQDFSEAALILNHLGEPEQPFEILQGDCQNHSYLDIDSLKKLL